MWRMKLRGEVLKQGRAAINGVENWWHLRHDLHQPSLSPFFPPHWRPSLRFLDIYQLRSKEALAKERARITDEMNRGYFADMSEMKKHGGKIAVANKTLIPAAGAAKFPALEVSFSDGRTLKLPINTENDDTRKTEAVPLASIVCLSFRASSQAMVESWTSPFLEAFTHVESIQLYEVSLVDSWFLSLGPIKKLLLRTMRKSSTDETNKTLQRQIVYYFGDHYYFRKELKILNLLTGYVFLLDKFGRIRWQGSGFATQEELSSLLSRTSELQAT